jgi:hypothetical protein
LRGKGDPLIFNTKRGEKTSFIEPIESIHLLNS